MTDQPQAEPDPPVETELKFELAPGQIARLAAHPALAQAPVVKRMTSTYFDTPSFALRQAGFTLRVRRVGRRFIQTVKRDRGGLFDRDEWETDVPALRVEPAALDETPAGKVLSKAGEPLVAVAVVRTHRAIRQWATAAASVEIAVDRCDIEANGRHHRFQELELELKDGPARVAHDLARSLFAVTPLRIGLTSKGERGYRLAGAKDAAFDPAMTPQSDVAAAFAAVAKACLAQAAEHAAGFRAEPKPEHIHQARVGLRRLRTAFRLFETAVGGHERDRLNAEVEWLSGELGPARALDVFLEDVFVPDVLSDQAVAKRYGERLQRARKAAYKRAATALKSERFAKLTLDLALWLEDGDWRRPKFAEQSAKLRAPIGPFAAEVLEDLRKTVKKRGKAMDELDAESRHKLRIRCKRLRYASEFFAHAFEGGRKRRGAFVGALKGLQDALGLLNDMAEAQASAASTLGKNAPQDLVFAAGELVGRLRGGKGKNLKKAQDGYKALMKADRFWSAKAEDEAPEPAPAD